MSIKSEHVKEWRRKTKERIIISMGSCCQICSYNKTPSALVLHHINPKEKELSFGAIRANPTKWIKIVEELRKCILLCHNCHSEVHDGITEIPKKYYHFNEDFVEYKVKKITKMDKCPLCGTEKPVSNKTCSYKCAGQLRHTVDWSKYNLLEMSKTMTNTRIAGIIGVSDPLISKKLKQLRCCV